jgi:hypothetical protein
VSRAAVRLTYRLHRFELIAVLGVAFLLVVGALVTTAMLDGVGIGPECFVEAASVQDYGDVPPTGRCFELGQRFNAIDHRQSSPLLLVAAVFPVLAGIVVGAPAVGRELERGTLPLVWTLGASRRRWLAVRLGVLLGFLVVALVPLALATDRLEAARVPTLDAARSFQDEGLRGWVLVARGVAAFAVTALLGLVIGRQVPAIVLGGIASAAIIIGAFFVVDAWAHQVAEPTAAAAMTRADRWVDGRLRSRADGTIVTFEEVYSLAPTAYDPATGQDIGLDGQWLDQHYEQIALALPGARYVEAVLIGSTVLLAGTALSLLAGIGLVERRRAT